MNALPQMALQAMHVLMTLKILLYVALVLLSGIASYYCIHIGNRYLDAHRVVLPGSRRVVRAFVWMAGVALFFWILHRFPSIRYLFNAILGSLVLAYILNPLIRWLERVHHMNRRAAILLVFVVIALIFFILGLTIFPRTVAEFKHLFQKLPIYAKMTAERISQWSRAYLGRDILGLSGKSVTQLIPGVSTDYADGVFGTLLASVKSVVSALLMLVLVPIFVYYFLADKEFFIDIAKSFIPKRHRAKVLRIGREMDDRVFRYVNGKILMAIYVGVVTGICLALLRVDFAFVIGVITIIADIIPYIGPFMALVPAVVFAFIDSPIKALWVILLFPIIQWSENNLVGPKILSDKIGLHPFFVLVAILVGGFLFGFVGMILALPAIIVLQVLYEEWRKERSGMRAELPELHSDMQIGEEGDR